MKKSSIALAAAGMLLLFLLQACASLSKDNRSSRCVPPPKGFSSQDLIGTWVAGVPNQRDTLILRDDGKYRQYVHIEIANQAPIDYVSEWQNWYLERSEEDILYLHLEGMRFCGMNPDIPCDRLIGGGYDFCQDRAIKMINEGILLVLVSPGSNSNSVDSYQNNISLFYPLGLKIVGSILTNHSS